MSLPPRTRRGAAHTASVLHHRDFRLLLGSQALANVGNWMQITILPWLVLRQTDSSVLVGATVAVQYLPILLAGPLGGLVADRFPRCRVVVITQLASAVPAIGLLFVVLHGSLTYPALLVAALAWGVVQLFDAPARQALVADTVPTGETTRALALSISTWHLGSVAGPALVGGLLTAADERSAFLVITAFFLIGAVLLVPIRSTPQTESADLAVGGAWAGLAYVRRNLVVTGMLLFVLGFSLFAMNRQVLVPLVARDVLHTGSGGFGLLMAMSGSGALIGALLLAMTGEVSPRLHMWLGLAWSVTLVAFGLSELLWMSAVLLGATGIFQVTFMTVALGRLQRETPSGLRGRVMAIHSQVMTGAAPAGAAQIGMLASVVGTAPTAAVCGVLAAAVAAAVWVAFPAVRRDDRELH